MPRKSTVSDEEAAASVYKILGTEGLKNIPESGSPLWEKISQDLQGKWKACTIHSYVSRDHHRILTLARAALNPVKPKAKLTKKYGYYARHLQIPSPDETSSENEEDPPPPRRILTKEATLAIKQEADLDESSSGNGEDSPPPRRILTKEEKSILLEYEKLELREAKMLSLFAVSYLRSVMVCPLRGTARMSESQYELSCGNSSFNLPITVDVKDFRKFLQDGNNCPYSRVCCGLRSSMVFSYKNEFRLHVLCQQCLEVTVYRLAR